VLRALAILALVAASCGLEAEPPGEDPPAEPEPQQGPDPAQEPEPEPEPEPESDPESDPDPELGPEPEPESEPPFDLSGRWTSSVFEDPFEAELDHAGDRALVGRMCGPSVSRGPATNCGSLTAAWTAESTIHFDFELPWADLGAGAIQYQFVGARGVSPDVFSGILVIDGRQSPITFTRCPDEDSWCP
jgi:hypothetical protein